MWVFGYGSLMTDGWEEQHNCRGRHIADLVGYQRVFNKASVRNWGTKAAPGLTLNLMETKTGICRGVAFEFPDDQSGAVLAELKEREGKNFKLMTLPVRLSDGRNVRAAVPLYAGPNIIEPKPVHEMVRMVLRAKGTKGTCADYVKQVAALLQKMGISDAAVTSLEKAVRAQMNPRRSA